MKYVTLKRVAILSLCLSIIIGMFSGLTASATRSGVEFVTATDRNSALSDLTAAMIAEIDSLPTTGALRNGRIRLSGFSQSASGSSDVIGLRGKYFLVHGENNNHYIIDGSWTGTNGEVAMKVGTHVDGSAAYFTGGASPTMAFEFNYRGVASNGMPLYVLRFNNGRNLAIGSQYANWKNLYYVKGDTTADLNAAPTVRFDHPAGVNWIRISNASGTHGLRQNAELTAVRWKDNSAGDNDYAGNALFLYRIWSTREIIAAIHEMRGYLDTPEFFDEEVYGQLLVTLREAIDLFRQYNSWPTSLVDPYDFIQEKLDAKEAELRSFSSKLNFEFKEPSAESLNAKTTIHQLPLACGYVIRTRGGKIIIIDGGWQDNNTEGTYLFNYLQKITGDPTPHIDAWFITHAHADHHGCVPTFANLYKDQVTIDAFYYHYPTYDEIVKYLSGCGVDSTWGAADWLPTWLLPNFKNAEGGPTKGIHCNTKQSFKCNNSFDFDDVHIEILLTFEDVIWAVENFGGTYSGTSANEGRVFSNKTLRQLLNDNFNETSMVFRVTVGGKSILFTGDINFIGGQMLNMFHDLNAANPDDFFTLKSDYVQVSHHGHYGLPKNSYYKIDPDVALWPCNYDEWNDYDYQNLICTKQWFNDMGAKSYVAYQGPHIFEFPLVRSGAIKIPAEIRDYVFDAEYYSNKYPDLAELYGKDQNQLYYHFVNYGIEEGRAASPYFDVKYYANQNGHRSVDTFKGNYVAAFRDFLNTYNTTNYKRWSELFDASVYATYHQDLLTQGIDSNFELLKHYLANGYNSGEIATNTFTCYDRNTTYHYYCVITRGVPPTCTGYGSTDSAVCFCGFIGAQSQAMAMTPHKEVTVPGTPATCTDPGLTEGKKCETCGTVLTPQETIPAIEHSYEYAIIDGLNHRITCANCDYSEQAPHSYENAFCICGDREIKDPVVDETVVINHTLNLASDISINFAVQETLLKDYVNHYLVVEIPVYSENTLTGTRTVTIDPVLKEGYYYYTLTGLLATQMGDVVSAQLHMEKNGYPYLSPVDTYSIAQYAYAQLNKGNAAYSLKVLCADLLRYGKEAQIFKGYRTDAPVDANMTVAHKAYLSDAEAVAFGKNDSILSDLENPVITWAGKALNLDSKISVKYIFNLENYTGDVENLTLKIFYINHAGKVTQVTLANPEVYDLSKNRYSFTFDGLLAAELRGVTDVAIYEGTTRLSQTLRYSPDTYGNNKKGQLLILCKALFAYVDSAKAYFG